MRAVLERDFVHEASRMAAFRSRTYLGVAVATCAVLVVWAHLDIVKDRPDVVAVRVFAGGGAVLVAMLALLTPAAVVGAVMVERLQETLPVVLASPVGPTRFALAKLLARAGTALSFALAAVPPLALTVLLGGVSGEAVLGLLVLATAVVLEMSAFALVLSTWSRRLATASLAAYLLPLGRWAATLALVASAAGSYRNRDPVTGALLLGLFDATPVAPLLESVDPGAFLRLARQVQGFSMPFQGIAPGATGPKALLLQPLWIYAGTSFVLAWAAVRLAGRRLRTESEPRSGPGKPRGLRRRLLRSSPGSGNPVTWKEGRLLNAAASRPLYYGLLLFVLISGTTLLFQSSGKTWRPRTAQSIAGWTSVYATAIGLLGVVTGAAAVAHERTRGTWDLLRASPLTLRQIAAGKMLGVLRGVAFVALPALALPFLLSGRGLFENGSTKWIAAGLTALFAVLWTAAGLTVGMRTARPGRAVAIAVLLFLAFHAAPLLAGELADSVAFFLGSDARPGAHLASGCPALLVRRSMVALEMEWFGYEPRWIDRTAPGRAGLVPWAIAYLLLAIHLVRGLPRTLRRGILRDEEGA